MTREKLDLFTRRITEATARRNIAAKALKSNGETLAALREEEGALKEAQALLQLVAIETQNELKTHIADIVQLALDTCWPDRYKFALEFETKRNQTEVRLVFLSGEHEINPIDANGGGVVDIVSFALRVAVWTLGNTRPCIVLDEPFRFLSSDLQPLAAEILRSLSDNLRLQFIMVTHSEHLISAADKVVHVERVNGVSVVGEK
jgi:chromosome segregation ATPase